MMPDAFMWAVDRFRPREGWLSLALLVSTIFLMVGAILEVKWVPEAGVVWITAVLGLILSYILAKKAKSTRLAWILIFLYGLLITLIRLAHLLPPRLIWQQGFWPLRTYWLQNTAVFLDRSGSWLVAVSRGHRSQETIIFAVGLGMVSWLLAAFAVWTTIRQRKPLLGLSVMGIALALNGFLGLSPLWYLTAFVGLAVVLSATINLNTLEQTWRERSIDFSDEIRIEMLIYVGMIAMVLVAAAMALPAFSLTKAVDAFMSHPWVKGAEESIDDAFGGVNKPRPRPPGSLGGYGVMPRSYLLGEEPPDLSEIIMMTAFVTDENGDLAPPGLSQRNHWRGLSYEIYTGRGWTLSEEREEPLPAYETVPLPEVADTVQLVQDINWLRDDRLVRYSLGQPVQFNQDVTLLWRGLDDYVRAQGSENDYRVTTQVSVAAPDDLRQTKTADVPAVILNRYTQLPDRLPQRVRDLAQEVAGDLANPYDQARALEQFLRQYPYSLEIESIPPGLDPVDYFLFDLQRGYCDYYASAMVVMARSLGLPARVAVGFLSQPPDEYGMQTIRQSNGHSWAEVYFAGYGWVEFEPTAGFASPHDPNFDQDWGTRPPEDFMPYLGDTAPLPDRAPVKRPIDWQKILTRIGGVAVIAGGLAALWLWQQRRLEAEDSVLRSYGRFQSQARKLEYPAHPAQTPLEFSEAFQENLEVFAENPKSQAQVETVKPLASRLTELYSTYQYAADPADESTEARTIWKKMKRPLWLLRLRKKFMK
ncbi:MAG: hypothetical protein IAF02_05930 [Anaerolineae bacterium]|nr:hypothetical protein [Anaerolineae bacterium]